VKPALIVNENFPVPALRKLRERGVDVLSVQEDMPGASDEAILARARATGRWLVTFDRDYGELVYSRQCPSPPAILYIRQEPYPADRPAEWILSLLDDPDQANGYMVVIAVPLGAIGVGSLFLALSWQRNVK
jgi:predicted nuclease of predicted toxin-antitoxin system